MATAPFTVAIDGPAAAGKGTVSRALALRFGLAHLDTGLLYRAVGAQVLGGMGLLQPYGLDRLSRLAQMLRIVDGTTEISRVVIGRALQKRAASLPDLPVPLGYGEADRAEGALAAE